MSTKFEITLPADWEADYDCDVKRWFFIHRSTEFSQYIPPKAGDEVTHAAESLPRRQGPMAAKFEGLPVVQEKQQSTITAVEIASPAASEIAEACPISTHTAAPLIWNETSSTWNSVEISPETKVSPVHTASSTRRSSGTVTRKPLRKPVGNQNLSQPFVSQTQALPSWYSSNVQPPMQDSVSGLPPNSTQTTIVAQQIWQPGMTKLASPRPSPISSPSQTSSSAQASCFPGSANSQHSASLPETLATTAYNANSQTVPSEPQTSAPESPHDPAQFHDQRTHPPRPKISSRLSMSAMKNPRKALTATKEYLQSHPGQTKVIAGTIVGGLGVAAEACGVDFLGDALTASKIYSTVRRAGQRITKPQSISQPLGQNSVSTQHTPSANEVALELFRMMKQQEQVVSKISQTMQSNQSQSSDQGTALDLQALLQQNSNSQNSQQAAQIQALLQQTSNQTNVSNLPSPQEDFSQNIPTSVTLQQDFNLLYQSLSQSPSPVVSPGSLSPQYFPDQQQLGSPSTTFSDQAISLLQTQPNDSTTDQDVAYLQLANLSMTDQTTGLYSQLLQNISSIPATSQGIFDADAMSTMVAGQDTCSQDSACYVAESDIFAGSVDEASVDMMVAGEYDCSILC